MRFEMGVIWLTACALARLVRRGALWIALSLMVLAPSLVLARFSGMDFGLMFWLFLSPGLAGGIIGLCIWGHRYWRLTRAELRP